MAPFLTLHSIICGVPGQAAGTTTDKKYYFLANPRTYSDSGISIACGVKEATSLEKAREVPVSVGALIGSAFVVGLTVYYKDSGGKIRVAKMLCAADKEFAFKSNKTGSTYNTTNAAGTAISGEITKIIKARRADFY